ncbi:M48 family metallopeptidase [Pseudomonas sp. HK3]
MDFFEHQAQAKAASNRLLLLFLAFCVFIVLCVNGTIYVGLSWSSISQFASSNITFSDFLVWQFSYAGFITSVVTLFIIGSGSFGRWLELRHGGNGMAVKLGARSLGFASKDETEQKLINVVEEMAIAAGVTTPGVYVLDHETSVNAFVVGYDFEDSALVVTNGLINAMNRDELQAVVGHEFSHILHGDNRINIRLMILLGGIVWVSELGRMLMADSRHRSGHRRSSIGFNKDNYNNVIASNSLSSMRRKDDAGVFFIGLPLIVIGSVGVFLGRLIRTAISRKREYLADASAVQFTRNPEALASALNIIRTNSHQGFLQLPRAEGISHMCISSSQKSSWFATHPPLDQRINSIDPTFIMRFESREKKQQREEKREQKQAQQTQAAQSIYNPDVARMQNHANEHLHDVIGTLNPENLAYAMSLHEQIPYEYRQALHDPELAKIMLLYVLMDTETALRQEQQAWLLAQYPASKQYLQTLTLLSQGLNPRLALPLVELLIPLLKTLDEDMQKGLLEQVLVMAKWDGKLTLFEICLYSLLKHTFEPKKPNRSSHTIKKFDVVSYEVNVIVSSLVHNAGGQAQEKTALHQRMMDVFVMKQQSLIAEKDVQTKDIYNSLKKLKTLSPMLKRSLMDVCGDIVLHDGIIQGSEYETVKLMSLLLACPMPAMKL